MINLEKITRYIDVAKNSIGKFVLVGGLGFIVNFVILSVLYRVFSLPILPSQLVAAEIAILSNFYFHNTWTYKDAVRDSIVKRVLEFHITSWLGSAMTTVILVVLVDRGFNYIFALVIGAVVALIWNFCWTRFVIWRPKTGI